MSAVTIQAAIIDDAAIIAEYDKHISADAIRTKINRGEVFVAYSTFGDQTFVGWLRYSLFWDSIPFMNMLFLLPENRGKGIGRQLVQYWESRMKERGYAKVLTSTQQNEFAQHFYVALGYTAIGGFAMSSDPYELLFEKIL